MLQGGSILRSIRPEVFCKKGVLKNVTKFTGKHMCQNLFFNKVGCFCTLEILTIRMNI